MTEKLNVMAQVQSEIKCPKGQKNTFGGYRFRSCEDIQEVAKPILHRLGLHLTLTDEIVFFPAEETLQTKGKDGTVVSNKSTARFYIKAIAEVRSAEGLIAQTCGYAREDYQKKGMDVAQVTGSASSYARKYALNGLFCLDDVKDPDTDAHTKQTQGKASQGSDNGFDF